MRINNNIMALNANRQLGINGANQSKSVEKLSSGLRINRAGDDAAGLAISEKMRAQIKGLNQASRNSQDAISMIQTAEGALNETHSILQRMRELAVQSASDSNVGTDRTALNDELTQLSSEVDRISTTTEFNTQKLLNGNLGGKVNANTTQTTAFVAGVAEITTSGAQKATYSITSTAAGSITVKNTTTSSSVTVAVTAGAHTISLGDLGITIKTNASFASSTDLDSTQIKITSGAATFQIGANSTQNISLSINNMDSSSLGLGTVDITTRTGADTAITTINTAITTVSSERSKLGALQNRLEHTIKNLDTASENLQASESRIRDVDMAAEMMEFTKNNILNQAATAMLSQANQNPQSVLQLLK